MELKLHSDILNKTILNYSHFAVAYHKINGELGFTFTAKYYFEIYTWALTKGYFQTLFPESSVNFVCDLHQAKLCSL